MGRRRQLLTGLGITTVAAGMSSWTAVCPAFAEEMAADVGTEELSDGAAKGPVVVLGARGATGRKVVTLLARGGRAVAAGTRSGSMLDPESAGLSAEQLNNYVTAVATDVTKPDTLMAAVKGASAVVFAASASPNGGSAAEVDRDGVIAAAEACIANGVPRLVIVSSGSVSKPKSPIYLGLNLFGQIMDAKIDGEDAVRALYAAKAPAGVSYTIVRPGGLTEEDPVGLANTAINQGDDISGRISRWDVAELCIQAIASPAAANATFECYNYDTAQPLAKVGASNILGQTADGPRALGPREHALVSSYSELFSGLAVDSGPQKEEGYPSLPFFR